MEWAIDARGILYLLQARPITASRSTFTTQKIINEEYDRIVKARPQKRGGMDKLFANGPETPLN